LVLLLHELNGMAYHILKWWRHAFRNAAPAAG
jgi:hypothetical protein